MDVILTLRSFPAGDVNLIISGGENAINELNNKEKIFFYLNIVGVVKNMQIFHELNQHSVA